jgi:hypothetical protein
MKLLGALLAAAVVSAQTHSECDPVKGDVCDPDPAFARNEAADFTKGPNENLFKPLAGTKLTYDDEKGMVMTCGKDTDAPTIASPEYMFFGELEVEMMAAPGKGIVTSIVLQSDCLDEIDWEWTGHKDSEVQSNYFSKGDDSTFDRGGTHPAPGSMSEFHIYKLLWTQEKLDWIIDGKVVRTLTYADAKGGAAYPQTPMQVKLGTWVAGKKDAPEGTKEWAGGQADFSAGPTHAYYKRISITDYAGGVDGAKSYVYTSEAGSWESIKVDTTGGDLAEKKQKEEEDSSSSSSGSKSNSTAALTKPTQTSYSNGPAQTEIPGSGAAGSFAVAGSLAAVGFFTVLFNML